jgi:hypothetical protein
MTPRIQLARAAGLLAVGLLSLQPIVSAQAYQVLGRFAVAPGWHNWYEIKAEPGASTSMMICGSRWDPLRSSLYGFVARSSDSGRHWVTTLEDRETAWISEVSCAFGRGHVAFFISGASRVVDGVSHHDQGVSRLFVSNDGGQSWSKTVVTGWADYTTSAVSSSSGELVTFFNDPGTADPGRGLGSSVAALVFSEGGWQVRGPILDYEMRRHNYQGLMPSQAMSMNDGSVVALYTGPRAAPGGARYDLGLVRVEAASPVSSSSIIATGVTPCSNLDGHALVYDPKSDWLIALYPIETSGGCELTAAISVDKGSTWKEKTILNAPTSSRGAFNHLSAALDERGGIGVLWEESGTWKFSRIKDFTSALKLELVSRPARPAVTNDSLMTFIRQPQVLIRDEELPTVTVNVRSLPGVVMRSAGLTATEESFHAIVPVIGNGYEGLQDLLIGKTQAGVAGQVQGADRQEDITAQIALLNGRSQTFDLRTGTLSIDLRLANRGDRAIPLPIRIEADAVNSRAGRVVIENADNGLKGQGAVWDISHAVTGKKLLPGTATYGSFRLMFHVDVLQNSIPTYDFLDLKLRVLAPAEAGTCRARSWWRIRHPTKIERSSRK